MVYNLSLLLIYWAYLFQSLDISFDNVLSICRSLDPEYRKCSNVDKCLTYKRTKRKDIEIFSTIVSGDSFQSAVKLDFLLN